MQKLEIRPLMPTKPKSEEIMDLAECLARTSGYNGFSFRDLAQAVNVKSASIHYHFPTKEDLGVAIARRYAGRVYEHLGDPSDPARSADECIEAFIDVFRTAVTDDGRVCLFLVFGSELLMLPAKVQVEVREFFDNSVEWLTGVGSISIIGAGEFFDNSVEWLTAVLRRFDGFEPGSGKDAVAVARSIIAALDGAMVGCRVFRDLAVFETIVTELKSCGMIPSSHGSHNGAKAGS